MESGCSAGPTKVRGGVKGSAGARQRGAGEKGVENNSGVSLLNVRFFPCKRLHDSLELKSYVNGLQESLSVCLRGLSQGHVCCRVNLE